MELNDILSLVKAGYTRAEIEQMERPGTPDAAPVIVPVEEPVQKAEPIPAPVDAPVAAAAPAAVPAPQPLPAQAQAEPTMAEIMQSIAKLTSAVQANAIAQSVIPGGVTQQAPTAEEMLAEIIRPTYHERK